MKIINGVEIAKEINLKNKNYVSSIKDSLNLTVVQVGDNPASNKYIKMKEKICNEVGIKFSLLKFDNDISERKLIEEINILNNKKDVTGIIVQLPLPKNIDELKIIESISDEKDADGFTQKILGKVMLGDNQIAPATPKGILNIFDYEKINLVGKNIVIIGRSNIVGKPLANMLINKQATVTICNSKTKKLESITKSCDILIVAIGSGKFIKSNFVSKGQIVIDVGANFVDGKYCGDVDFDDVKDIVGAITPVPGGVGPLTVCTLIDNVINLYKKKNNQ